MKEEVLTDKMAAYRVIGERSLQELGIIGFTLAFFRNNGGLWIGGRVRITPTTVHLIADSMYSEAQSGALDIEIPIATIRKVAMAGGFVTKIVRIDTDTGAVKFRCYGARLVWGQISRLVMGQALKRHA